MPLSKEDVAAAGSKQQELLDRLAKTEHAKPALHQTTQQIDDLESHILALSKNIKKLQAITSKEKEDHQKYHEASWRRVAYHLSGHKDKFESKAKKEEREYFEAVQQEQKAKDELETYKKEMYSLGDRKREPDITVKEYQTAQQELDSLYDSIFGGKTPDFPEEDEKEAVVCSAKHTYDRAQQKLVPEQQALKLLSDAMDSIHEAIHHMDDALNKTHSDLLSDSSDLGQIMAKHSLSKAQTAASRTEMQLKQAQKLSPNIEDIGSMRISQSAMMSAFDDPVTSIRKKIEQSDTELRYAAAALSGQLSSAKRRVKALHADSEQEKTKLDQARAELQRVRTEAFKQMTLR